MREERGYSLILAISKAINQGIEQGRLKESDVDLIVKYAEYMRIHGDPDATPPNGEVE